MKKISVIITLILIVSAAAVGCQRVIAQGNHTILNDIVECFVDRDADKLATYFNERVEITLMGSRREYAKSQAKFVIKEFIQDFPPDAFSFAHQGQTDNTIYALGTYHSSEGSFKVDMFLRLAGDYYRIDQIRFEKKK
ncbi:MAG: DUF4783 domain-containing protein [Bacteroidota bacterium]